MNFQTNHLVLLGNRGAATLTAEEERALNIRRLDGDAAAREELILRNIGLVATLSRNWAPFINPAFRDDLRSEALSGLIEAVDAFDHTLGRLGGFASYRIRARMNDVFGDFNKAFRVPRAANMAWRKLVLAALDLETQGKPITVAALQDATGLKKKTIQHWLAARGSALSIDTAGADDDDSSGLHDTLTMTRDHVSPAESDAARVIEIGLQDLDPRIREIVTRRFGLTGEPPATLEDLAAELRITRERVRQLEFHGLRKMRETCRRKFRHGYGGMPEEVRSILAALSKETSVGKVAA